MDAPAAAAAAAAAVQMLCLVSANVGGNLAANRGRKRSLSAMGQSSAPAPPTLVTPLGLGDAGDLAAKSALTKPESPTDANISSNLKNIKKYRFSKVPGPVLKAPTRRLARQLSIPSPSPFFRLPSVRQYL